MNDYSESLLVHFRRIESLRQEALGYPGLDLDARQLSHLELLLNRAYYPLRGFLGREDYESVLNRMRLADGTVWPLPICLDVDEKTAAVLTVGQHLALNDQEGFMLAVLKITDLWQPDLVGEAAAVFGTSDPTVHLGVQSFFEQTRPWYVGGRLEGLHLPIHYDFKELRLTPAETHRRFSMNGWRQVIGVQTEDYLHRAAQEEILAAARTVGANIFLQPTMGSSEPGDREHYTRVRCYQEIAGKFPRNMVVLGLLPQAQWLAGPREALLQALVKRNYGCSHFLVADDQADPLAGENGRERCYPLGAAQELIRVHEQETGIVMVPLTRMAFVEEKAEYLPVDRITAAMTVKTITPAELRRRLENDLPLPDWYTYPEIVEELKRAFPPRSRQGFTIFISGLSGSGKSTLARALLVRLMEMRDRPVTLLDGDIVRRNLSSELTFSREHRNLNITRIGFVASEITKNGGIALCAPIAPYEESRRANRELISRCGGYIEVYMSTPMEVCELRDRKGLYAKARSGKIKAFTGVSDPYEVPANPDLVIDTTSISPAEAAQEVLLYLGEQGYMK